MPFCACGHKCAAKFPFITGSTRGKNLVVLVGQKKALGCGKTDTNRAQVAQAAF
jgi:hypothetical protein